MTNKKGFTLIEIIIVMIIFGILTAVALPNYFTMLQQGAANAAQNNLLAIYNAQLNYYNTNNAYCLGPCDTLADINTNLALNLTDNNFSYACVAGPAAANGFQCIATGPASTITLINSPIVSTGATTCATSSAAGCNPICAPAGNGCPT